MSPGVHDKMIITNIIVDFAHISCMDTKNMECDHFFENGCYASNAKNSHVSISLIT